MKGFLVLENGLTFEGKWLGGEPRAGEVVFNTSHSGYEEIATDPSYFSQIIVMTAPQQGNYGVDSSVWESAKLWIEGFICVEMQQSARDSSWSRRLTDLGLPLLTAVDTRRLVLHLRNQGTCWGALVQDKDVSRAKEKAQKLIAIKKKTLDRDWAYLVSRQQTELLTSSSRGPRVAVLDFGCKINILRELEKRCRELAVFGSRTSAAEIRKWNPDGILLSNGPGDPADVKMAVETVKDLLGWRYIFGICMGHQILSLALGGRTYKLKFGHRGSNHPIRDQLLNKIYVTSQNHGYAVDQESLPKGIQVTHTNMNDNTVAGISCPERKCFSVQFHPESHPGPHDAEGLFDYFVKQIS